MSEDNIELIRRSYNAFNRRDLAAMRPLIHPDFTLDFSNSLGPDRGVYAGEEGVRKLFEPYWSAFESISIEPEEFIEGDAGIIAVVRARGRGHASGVMIDARGPHLWSFHSGRIIGFSLYQELEQALAAAGLTKQQN